MTPFERKTLAALAVSLILLSLAVFFLHQSHRVQISVVTAGALHEP